MNSSPDRPRVLVVDDTAANRYAVVRTLAGEGFEVLEADGGERALELARSAQPDVVVLDVKLPDILGFEVARRLRASPDTASVGILQLSATYTDADAQASGLTAGADAYLLHPFDGRVLVATVRALLRMRAAERRAAQLLSAERRARAEAERAREAVDRAERAQRAADARLRRLNESGLIGIAYWNYSGELLDANDAFLRMAGCSREDLEAGTVNLRAITAQGGDRLALVGREQLRQRGETEHFELQYLHRDGTRVDVLLAAATIEGTDGGVAIALDISKRKRIETERARLLGELEQAIRARDEFLSIATHDIKSPLTALQLSLGIMQRTLKQGGEQASADKLGAQLAAASARVQRIVELLESLLDVSRISSGRLDIYPEPNVDLAGLAREVAERMRDQFAAAGCALELDAAAPVLGNWDRLRLEQVMTNLLSNAVKYGPGKPIQVSVSESGATAALCVRDEGIGIAPEDRERIFEQFERALPDGARKSFGLGLWIVRRIVDALGGAIHVESELGRGSCFSVELPKLAAGVPNG